MARLLYLDTSDLRYVKQRPEALTKVLRWLADDGFLAVSPVHISEWLGASEEVAKGDLHWVVDSFDRVALLPPPSEIAATEFRLARTRMPRVELSFSVLGHDHVDQVVARAVSIQRTTAMWNSAWAFLEADLRAQNASLNTPLAQLSVDSLVGVTRRVRQLRYGPEATRDEIEVRSRQLKMKSRARKRWVVEQEAELNKLRRNLPLRVATVGLAMATERAAPRVAEWIGTVENLYYLQLHPALLWEAMRSYCSPADLLEATPQVGFTNMGLAAGMRLERMKESRKPKLSDLGDEMHFLYLNVSTRMTMDPTSVRHALQHVQDIEQRAQQAIPDADWSMFEKWRSTLTANEFLDGDWSPV